MSKKIDKIKNLLRKHNYEVYVELNSSSTCEIRSFFPERKEPPVLNLLSIVYFIDQEDFISFTINGEENDLIPCKRYVFEAVIFTDINRLCDYYGYNTKLMGFYLDGESVEESKFKENLAGILKLNKSESNKKKIMEELLLAPALTEGQLDLCEDEIKEQYLMIQKMSEIN